MKKKTMAALVMMGLCAMGASAILPNNQSSSYTDPSGHAVWTAHYWTSPAPATVAIWTQACGNVQASLQNQVGASCTLYYCEQDYLQDTVTQIDPNTGLVKSDGCQAKTGDDKTACCTQSLTHLFSCIESNGWGACP